MKNVESEWPDERCFVHLRVALAGKPETQRRVEEEKMLYTKCFVHSIIGLVFKQQPLSQHACVCLSREYVSVSENEHIINYFAHNNNKHRRDCC